MTIEATILNSLKPRFSLGLITLTQGFMEACVTREITEMRANELISRHAVGDWGDVCEVDAGKNNIESVNKGMILSKYTIPAAADTSFEVYVITDPGHDTTIVLLTSEY
jgi:hypothetical protein